MKNRWNVLLVLLIFIGTFVFFAVANPLVVWDGDDWVNLSYMRKPFPYWKQWNPTKLLPEIGMPFAGYVAAYIVNPVVQDYIASITYVSAFLTALGISVFSLLAGLYVCKLVELPRQRAGIFALILTLLSFLIFKKSQYDNTFLFFAGNLTCYYHYVFPLLVNGITVLTLCLAGDLRTAFHSWSRARQAGFLLLCWFSLFSNIMQSVIIATYALSKIVESYVLRSDKRLTLANARAFFLSNRGYFCWLACGQRRLCGFNGC